MSSSTSPLLPVAAPPLLLPISHHDLRPSPTYTLTTTFPFILRSISAILALTSFIILVIDGGPSFIAADILLMLLVLMNLGLSLHHYTSQLLKISIELRQQPWSKDFVQQKTSISRIFDIAGAAMLALCLLLGSAFGNRWGGAWKAAVVLGWLVVAIQVAVVAPIAKGKALKLNISMDDEEDGAITKGI